MTDQPPPTDAPPMPTPEVASPPPADTTGYAKYFTDGAFWQKVKDFAGRIGRGTLTKAMELYHVAMSKDTPVLAKAIALGSLGYLIMPLDAIPDILPGVGLADDAAALAAAATAIFRNITPAVKAAASDQVAKWFGPDKHAVPVPPTPEAPATPDVPSPS